MMSYFLNYELNVLNVIITLIALKELEAIGRYKLSKILDVGEGIARRILNTLSKERLVVPHKYHGCRLTKEGERFLSKILNDLSVNSILELDLDVFKVGPKSVVVHLSDKAHKITSPIYLRDIAIMVGADGVTVLTYRNSKLEAPYLNMDTFQESYRKLEQSFKLKENDILIIGSGKDYWKALKGALAVAISLY